MNMYTCTCTFSWTYLVYRCRRASSAVSGTFVQASHEWFWPEYKGLHQGFHHWRNHLNRVQVKSTSLISSLKQKRVVLSTTHVPPKYNLKCFAVNTQWGWQSLTSLEHKGIALLREVFPSRFYNLREVKHCDRGGRISLHHLTGKSACATWELFRQSMYCMHLLYTVWNNTGGLEN